MSPIAVDRAACPICRIFATALLCLGSRQSRRRNAWPTARSRLLKPGGESVEPIEGKVVEIKTVSFVGMGDRWQERMPYQRCVRQTSGGVALAHNPDSIDRLPGHARPHPARGSYPWWQINLFAVTACHAGERRGGWAGHLRHGEKQVFCDAVAYGMIGLPIDAISAARH